MPRLLRFLLVFAVLVAALAAGGWYYVEDRFDSQLRGWAEARRAEGWTVDWTLGETGGFPLAWRREITGATITLPSGLSVEAAPVTLELRPEALDVIRWQAPGRHRLALAEKSYSLQADGFSGVARSEGGGPFPTLEMAFSGMVVAGLPNGLARAQTLNARVAPPPADHGYPEGAIATVDFDAADVVLPEGIETPLGHAVKSAQAETVITGRPVKGTTFAEVVEQWRSTGGTIDLNRIHFDWESLTVDGDGRLTLDEQRRLLGAFAMAAQGLPEVMRTLGQRGYLPIKTALTAQFALAQLLREEEGFERPVVRAPITFQDGTMSMGPIPLFRLRPLF